ncbi:hypothetical protein Belba_0880 [Belliella baltica DSM 15883]|uniref:Uncharacterized protein n=1 Tax=Belliella baltica (strain DSM 15883 / CIP 108006 / LMG 21964 / BA134) TaxID=866536 RepID=I3Z2Q9_BELBD|nr:hypothetical protein Belba_0880 [Belliella baltica DSM 15883]
MWFVENKIYQCQKKAPIKSTVLRNNGLGKCTKNLGTDN